MCKNIDYLAAEALENGKRFKMSNTLVENGCMYLHGYQIARIDHNGDLFINLCGWNTLTTRSRLNALKGVDLRQKKHKLFLNGEEIEENKEYKI